MKIPFLKSVSFDFVLDDVFSVASFIDTYKSLCLYQYPDCALVFLVRYKNSSSRCEITRSLCFDRSGRPEYLRSSVRYFSSPCARKPRVFEYFGSRALENALETLL